MSKLIIENGPNKGRELHLTRGTMITCGRDSIAELPLTDGLASRRHFRIETRDGDFFLVDLKSSNGTFLNGRKITEQRLRTGDNIQVGETRISVLEDTVRADTGGLLGRTISGYRLEKRIGRGGMGTVYKAMQLSLDRPAALKILSKDLVNDRSFTTMFINEARAAARLSHPNIVLAYDVGKDKDMFFFAMEYVSGGSVQDLLAKKKMLPLDQAVKFIIEAAKGLDYAEKRGIVHRDIKPDNLMITDDGGIKICDLGLAKRFGAAGHTTGKEGICGSPHYIAPEQARDKTVDHRADIYSLGATFYRMVAGATPFTGGNIKELIKKHVTEDPRPILELRPDLPDSIVRVITRMMKRDPAERYQSAREVINDLKSLQAFGYELEFEPDLEPELAIPEAVPAETEEEPLLLEEEPLTLEGSTECPEVWVIKPPKAPPGPREEIQWNKTHRTAEIAGVILGLAVVLALITLVVIQVVTPLKPWHKELLKAREMASTDIKGAVQLCRKVQNDYADNAEAQNEASNTMKELKKNLIAQAKRDETVEKFELLKNLFPEDLEALAVADLEIRKIEKRAESDKAEKYLREMRDDALAFETDNRSNLREMLCDVLTFKTGNRSNPIEKADDILEKFQALPDKKNEKYKDLSSPAINNILKEAGEKVKEYKGLIKALSQEEFDTMNAAIRSAVEQKQYAQARKHLEAAENQFALLIKYIGRPVGEHAIEDAAYKEYYQEVWHPVMTKLRKAEYNPNARAYTEFASIHKDILNPFLNRYGEGRLKIKIDALTAQMRELQKLRNQVQDQIEKGDSEAGAEILKNLPRIVRNPDLKHLVDRAMKVIKTARLNTEQRQIVEAFLLFKENVTALAENLQTTEALSKLENYKNDGKVIQEIKDDYDDLLKQVKGLHDFLGAVAGSVTAAMSRGAVILPSYDRTVERINAESIKLTGWSEMKWNDLLGEESHEDISALFEYATDNIRNDSERLGAAVLCLKYGDSLKTLRLGYDSMSDLAGSLPSMYGGNLKPYIDELLGNIFNLEEKMTQEYRNTGEPEELKRKILALKDFRQDVLRPALEKIEEGGN